MDYVQLGGSDIRASRLCVGCMSFGDPASKMHAWTLDPQKSEEIIRHALNSASIFLTVQTPILRGTSEEYLDGPSRTMLPG